MEKLARIAGGFPTKPEKSGKFAILVGGFPTVEKAGRLYSLGIAPSGLSQQSEGI